jgi:anti-repressor homolog
MKKCTISFPVRKYGKIEVCKPSYTIAEFAEIITQRICDVYETDLFEWFCDSGYIEYKDVCNSYPNRELFDIGLLGTSTREERCCDGELRIINSVFLTEKGVDYFINKYLFG